LFSFSTIMVVRQHIPNNKSDNPQIESNRTSGEIVASERRKNKLKIIPTETPIGAVRAISVRLSKKTILAAKLSLAPMALRMPKSC